MNNITVSVNSAEVLSIETATQDPAFWYSRRAAAAFVIFLLVLAHIMSFLIPPFQSPDEPEHLKRAYLLSRGEIFLGSNGGLTGGNIDTGLLAYIESFDGLRFQYDHKVTSALLRNQAETHWSGHTQFRGFPNTAFYFPLPYLPQAVALSVGKNIRLTVQQSYYLARALSLLVTGGLLVAALLVYPIPLIALAVFLTPMTLFQLGSASLDSVTFGLSALAGALFMRGAHAKLSFNVWMHAALIVCLFSLATSRVTLFALTPLPLLLYAARKSRWYLISSAVLISSSAAWIAYALRTVKGTPPRELTTVAIIEYYVGSPSSFVRALFDTISNGDLLGGYWRMFVGVLGWLDTPLSSAFYAAFGILFILLGLLSLGHKPALQHGSISLAIGAMFSLFATFFVFLVTYDPHPVQTIEGIQGRYFIPIVLMLAYALFNRRLSPSELIVGLTLVALMIPLTVAEVTPRLLARYWLL